MQTPRFFVPAVPCPVYEVRRQLALFDNAPTGRGVRVAILDTGVDSGHPDLKDRIDHQASRSLLWSTGSIEDRNGHGTHLAGIIAGTGAMSAGYFRGIAPETTLVIYRVSADENGYEANAAAAIEAALDAKVDIINFSHGYIPRSCGDCPWVWPEHLTALEQAFAAASARGILCVVAAGNEGPALGSITRPGGLECVLTVGCLGRDGRVFNSSSRGPYRRLSNLRAGGVRRLEQELDRPRIIRKPDIVVPGEQVASTRVRAQYKEDSGEDPYYTRMTGSSQATAVASGLTACVLDLVRTHAIDLGGNPAQALSAIFRAAAGRLEHGGHEDFGSGAVFWPMLKATLEDFARHEDFRVQLLHGGGPPTLLN